MKRVLICLAGLLLCGCGLNRPRESCDAERFCMLAADAAAQCADTLTVQADVPPDAAGLAAALSGNALSRMLLRSARWHTESGAVTVQFSYDLPPSELMQMKQTLRGLAESWRLTVSRYPQRIRLLMTCDRIRSGCTYADLGAVSHSAYGALIAGKAVCEGFAEAMLLLCEAADIPCLLLEGTAGAGETAAPHAWNLVQLHGIWYHIDCTWDTPGAHAPLLLCDGTAAKTHQWNRAAYPAASGGDICRGEITEEMLQFSGFDVTNPVPPA